MKNKKISIIISIIVVLAVIAFLVFITINKKGAPVLIDEQQVGQEQNINMENVQSVDGLKITILKEGKGEIAKSGDTVAMNYTGVLADGTVFDSNIDPKFNHVEPFVFNLGAGQVIKGWDVGVAGMKVGEQRKLEIAPELAYGDAGAGGVIPPKATLIFMVELVAIK
jgi:FKBP-type peptidyl-prolyl cis-trans isomerase